MMALLEAVGDRSGVAMGLEGVAAVDVTEGRVEFAQRAVRLLGAAEVLLKASGTSRAPADQVQYEQIVAGARAQLGAEPFARAWAAGQAMTLDDAVRDAATPLAAS